MTFEKCQQNLYLNFLSIIDMQRLTIITRIRNSTWMEITSQKGIALVGMLVFIISFYRYVKKGKMKHKKNPWSF